MPTHDQLRDFAWTLIHRTALPDTVIAKGLGFDEGSISRMRGHHAQLGDAATGEYFCDNCGPKITGSWPEQQAAIAQQKMDAIAEDKLASKVASSAQEGLAARLAARVDALEKQAAQMVLPDQGTVPAEVTAVAAPEGEPE